MPETKRNEKQKLASLNAFREYVAAALAGVIVLGSIVLFGIALTFVANQDEYNRVKDLVQLIVPILTFVLGYYFNQTSTASRAENAEHTAQNAVETAQMAKEEREEAKTLAARATSEAQESKAVLSDMYNAAESMMREAQSGSAPGVLSAGDEAGETTLTRAKTIAELQNALERARRLMGRSS